MNNGDKVTVKGDGSREVFTVSQLTGNRCWIGDAQGRGWYIYTSELETVEELTLSISVSLPVSKREVSFEVRSLEGSPDHWDVISSDEDLSSGSYSSFEGAVGVAFHAMRRLIDEDIKSK